jgi:signal transduction histidine kinase
MATVDGRIAVLHARFWLVFAVSISAASLIIFVLIWPSIRRIKELIRGTEHIAQGDFDVRIDDDKNDELAHLGHAFNAMAADLKSLKEELEQNNRTLEHKVGARTAELHEALEKLKTLDKMKDDFLSSVSHEFRTPLTSIRSFTEILLEVPEEDEQTKREFLNIIRTESDRLTRLVNDILDLVKMEAGELRFEFKPVDLTELVEGTVNSLYPIVQARSVRMHVVMAEHLPRVWADADKVTQVVFNVIGNALKFSPDGRGIDVEVKRTDATVSVSVRDRGVGVPDGDLERIFEKFSQVGDTLKNKPKGTGLGLSICRSLIERHGGRIWAERPSEGPGLRVVFEIPIVEAERGEPRVADAHAGEVHAGEAEGLHDGASHEKTSPAA